MRKKWRYELVTDHRRKRNLICKALFIWPKMLHTLGGKGDFLLTPELVVSSVCSHNFHWGSLTEARRAMWMRDTRCSVHRLVWLKTSLVHSEVRSHIPVLDLVSVTSLACASGSANFIFVGTEFSVLKVSSRYVSAFQNQMCFGPITWRCYAGFTSAKYSKKTQGLLLQT